MIKTKLTKIIALCLIFIGGYLGLLTFQNIVKRNTPVNFSQTTTKTNIDTSVNYPVAIEFSSLPLTLPVSNKNIKNNKWDDPEYTVGYWVESPLPGEPGNSIMYGHNWPNLLAKLPKITKGHEIVVGFKDGSSKKFKVDATYVVSADQTHILNQTDDIRLTIYTCTGFLDSKRFVVIATPSQ